MYGADSKYRILCHAGTGECDQHNVCDVTTYPVEVTDGAVRVGVPA